MPIVTMPDGVAVDFGDLPDDQIRSMIQQKFPDAATPKTGYDAARDRWRETVARAEQRPRYQGYGGTVSQMANESAGQIARGAGQLSEAGRFAISGAGRNVVPDTPANRVAGGFSALDPSQPQAPLTTAEHLAANRQAIGNVASGFGNLALGGLEYLASPVNAAVRVAVGNPVEQLTGIPREYPEFAATLAVPGRVPKLPARGGSPAPSVEQLKAAGSARYEGPAIKDLEIPPQELSTWSVLMRSKLDEAGLVDVAESAPGTHAILKRMEAVPPGAAVTGTNIHSLIKALRHGPGESIKGSEREAARLAIENLSEFIPTVTAIKGNTKAASEALRTADADWSAAKHAELLNAKQYAAELNAATANSGLNVENSIRQQVKTILKDPKQRRGFTDEQIASMERIAHGDTTGRNTIRGIGNLAQGGGGLGATGIVLTSIFAGQPQLAAIPVAGYLVKKLGNALTIRDVNKLNESIRANSPLGKQLAGPFASWGKAAQNFEVGPTPRALAMLSIASRNLSNNLADAGISVSPDNLMRSLQGPMRGSAEQEQP